MYDGANRLKRSASLSGITTYSYDPAGNRRTVEDPSGDLTTFTWNAENQQVQVELASGEIVTTLWDPINKNSEERIVQRDDGVTVTKYLWDNNNLIRETDDVGTVEADYTYQPQPYGELLSQHREMESSFYHYDALGSTTSLSDQAGATTNEYHYQAFGEAHSSTGSTENPYQWVGKLGYRKDEATGLNNLRARNYDSKTGQFTSADPLGLEAGDSNFYRYVGNQAVQTTDPSGNGPEDGGPFSPIPGANQCSAPEDTCGPDTWGKKSGDKLLDAAIKELGLASKEDLINGLPLNRLLPLWMAAEARGECCPIFHSPDAPFNKACRIAVPLPCGGVTHFWVTESRPGLFEGRTYTIIGNDDGSRESFQSKCRDLEAENWNTVGQAGLNRIPLVGTANQVCEGNYSGAAISGIGDLSMVLGGAGVVFKSAGLLRAAAIVSSVGGVTLGSRGLYNLYQGNYDEAAYDTFAALLYLWGAKQCLKQCAGLRKIAPSNIKIWEGLPLRENSYGLAEEAAGSFVNRRILLSSKTPDGLYKFVIDSDGKVWLGLVTDDIPHSALIPKGNKVYSAGYVFVTNGKANVNGRSGHYMAETPVTSAIENKYDCALRQTFSSHGVTVINHNVGLGGDVLRPPAD